MGEARVEGTAWSPGQLDWYRQLARRSGAVRDREGTRALVDASSGQRAAAAIRSGQSVSLSRAVSGAVGGEDFSLEVKLYESDEESPVKFGVDEVVLHAHGLLNTHIDALNHVGIDGTWYSGWSMSEPGPSIADWRDGIVTRAVLVDIAGIRGAEWVEAAEPVRGDEIESSLSQQGLTFQPGDALLLDMGRDRFEAAGNNLPALYAEHLPRPGVGRDGAEWIADNRPSVLCWDFLDAMSPGEWHSAVHLLMWATGLVLIDNCDFSRLRSRVAALARQGDLALSLAPLVIPGATGSNINPLAIL